MSTLNKAYNFSDPLSRAIKAYLRATDPALKADFKTCAQLLIAASADLRHPDKHSPSGMTEARILQEKRIPDALALLQASAGIMSSEEGSIQTACINKLHE
jgi:hypothetical protein